MTALKISAKTLDQRAILSVASHSLKLPLPSGSTPEVVSSTPEVGTFGEVKQSP